MLHLCFLMGPLFTYASPRWFPFLSATNITKLECLYQATSCTIIGCFLSSPIPLLSEASLPPLRVTVTHFVLSSHECVLCLLTLFPISDLARLGVKPNTPDSFWRAFVSTSTSMLLQEKFFLLVLAVLLRTSLPSVPFDSMLPL